MPGSCFPLWNVLNRRFFRSRFRPVARVPSLPSVHRFGGAILGSAIIYILPTIIMLAADAKGVMALSPAEKLACRGVNLMGYVLAVLGGAASILARMGKL